MLVEVEGTLNHRPLIYVYDEVGEEILTSSHFLYGGRVTCMLDEVDEPPDHHQLEHNARYRWHREYLTVLREHHASSSRQTDRRGGSYCFSLRGRQEKESVEGRCGRKPYQI